jgi:hypothetical protein
MTRDVAKVIAPHPIVEQAFSGPRAAGRIVENSCRSARPRLSSPWDIVSGKEVGIRLFATLLLIAIAASSIRAETIARGPTVVSPAQSASVFAAPAIGNNNVAPSGTSGLNPFGNGIQYSGGPVIDDAPGVNVYLIWYGAWGNDSLARHVIRNFVTHIGGTPYFDINTTYFSVVPERDAETHSRHDRVLNKVNYRGGADDFYSQGSSLSRYQVYLIVSNAISSGLLPADPNGVYFVLTSGDVSETGFGTNHCGWHSSSLSAGLPAISGVDVKFAFVGDAEPNFAYTCIWNYQTTLSGSLGADGMTNIIAHELNESTTDPDGTSWVNPHGVEISDLCEWTFGAAYHSGSASDPYPTNMTLNGIPYLIQENWLNHGGGSCELRWKNAPSASEHDEEEAGFSLDR